jgi:hypothetical protein
LREKQVIEPKYLKPSLNDGALPTEKSQTRNNHDKDAPKSNKVYSERGMPLPVLKSGGE